MKAIAGKIGALESAVASQMTRAQAFRLKSLAEEAYQPRQFQRGLATAEAEQRIAALKAEIDLANSF